MKKILPYILFTVFCFVYALTLSAQNLGIATPGTTNYLKTNIGNTQTASPTSNGGFTLIFDQFTTTFPLTAISISTFGTVSSGANNLKVAIYSDNGSNSPGTLLFAEVSATVTANTTSSIPIPNTFLPAGKYWLAFNMNANNNSNTNFVTKSSGIAGAVRMFTTFNSFTFATAFPANASVLSLSTAAAGTQDMIYFTAVAIEGYAKATKAILSAKTAFSSVSFYSHAAGNVRLAIYSDNGSGTAPSAKQWESGDITITAAGQPKLTTVNITSGAPTTLTLTAGTYWLAWQWNTTTTGPSYSAGSANTGNAIVQAYGAFPASWSGGTASTENWTMYATFCTPPTASATQSNISCFGNSDGTIVVSGSGGSGTISGYSINNGTSYPASPTFTGLGTGQYKIRVIDNIGCESKLIQ